MTTPLLLKGAIGLPDTTTQSGHDLYDPIRQIWVDASSGIPIVVSAGSGQTRYGETSLTETREGVDQSETAGLLASRFGETSMTKSIEGVDQSEIVSLLTSRMGETTVTATREGADRSEGSASSEDLLHAADPDV